MQRDFELATNLALVERQIANGVVGFALVIDVRHFLKGRTCCKNRVSIKKQSSMARPKTQSLSRNDLYTF